MAGPFYFAWVDNPADTTETDTATFQAEYIREDEDVFSVMITHEEGEFPVMELTIRNPRVGLLGPGRKRWAWLSYDDGSGVSPLFYGRLVGIPQSIQAEMIKLQFVAKPFDYTEQKAAVAEEMRVAPYYDPVLLSEDARNDPDTVLEGYGALWHIDRVTHEVTASDIITGEDGTLNIGEDISLYDITDMQLSGSPARKCVVRASVTWEQNAAGVVNITGRLLRALNSVRPLAASDVNGNFLPWNDDNAYLIGAGGMASAWPKPGADLGGGWEVFQSTFNFIGRRPNGDIIVAPESISDRQAPQRAMAGRGILLKVGEPPSLIMPHEIIGANKSVIAEHKNHRKFLWIPITPFNPFMSLQWVSDREYTEELAFELGSDVQDVLSEAGEDEVISLDYANTRIDTVVEEGDFPIGDVKRRAYFPTTRGQRTLATLIALARAQLLARARVAQIKVGCPFAVGLDLSCRKSAVITDRRFPGGQVAGKVSAYVLSFDGSSGKGQTEITISACVGRGGSVSASAGTPTYADDGYTGDEYQLFEGGFIMPIPGEVVYQRNSLFGTLPADDGKSLFRVGGRFVKSVVVTGGIDEQIEISGGVGDDTILENWAGGAQSLHYLTAQKPTITGLFGTFPESFENKRIIAAALSPEETKSQTASVVTKIRVEMVPIEGGPFLTSYNVLVSDLKIPKTIDLEAV